VLEDACWIEGISTGFARVTATAAANPDFSEGFNVLVVQPTALSDSATAGDVQSVNLESYYVVTGLSPGFHYAIDITGISLDEGSLPDYEVFVGTATAETTTLDALYADGYAEDPDPFVIQGFASNDGDSTSLIFTAVTDWQYFIVVDGTADESLGNFTFDYDVSTATIDSSVRLIETIPCNSGTDVDTTFNVFDENENIVCGSYDKTADNAYSRVIVPSLPSTFYVQVLAQEEDDRVIPGYAATGDYALYIEAGTTPFIGALPSTVDPDPDEIDYESLPNYGTGPNYTQWPTIGIGSAYVRKIDEEGDFVEQDDFDIDMFKSW
jgi:hypothetical protein